METTYQITGYQLVYADGTRDNVKLQQPVMTGSIEYFRDRIKQKKGCASVNLSYIELPAEDSNF